MYLSFFSLSERPFDITPDTRFLYPSANHEEAMRVLLYGIRERRGFMVLTGEVGIGKTTSLRALLNRLDSHTETSLIINPLLSTLDLIKSINHDFGISAGDGHSIQDQIAALNAFLLTRAKEGKNAVVIIDESQDLSLEALEMVRLLSNLETETHKLMQLILVGQPELETKLAQSELRQLRQRIQVRHTLQPLNCEDTKKYVLFRLNKAAPRCCLVFQPAALKKIHEYSGGIPRVVNTIAELSLMAAYLQETHVVSRRIVETAYEDMQKQPWSESLPFLKRWTMRKRGVEDVASP